RVPDAKRAIAVQYQARRPLAALGVEAVGAAQILGDERARGVAEDAEVLRRDVGIVDQHVIRIGAADADLGTGATVPGHDLPVARQNLDPDHLCHWIASRKRWVSATALS